MPEDIQEICYYHYPEPDFDHADFFTTIMMHDLIEYGICFNEAFSIAHANLMIMSCEDKKYHNYIHPLAMFDFAEDFGIELDMEQRLAIWFHDSIYDPKEKVHGRNETRSNNFMCGCIKDTTYYTEMYISATTEYLSQTPNLVEIYNKKALTVMDLDLHTFALDYDKFCHAGDLVRQELGTTKKQTIGFYKLLLARAPIFRTEEFARFESQAISNINRFISEHEQEN